MSLDVYLTGPVPMTKAPTIYVRENGQNREITREEWEAKFPGTEPVVVDERESNELYSANITHNLGKMADAAGIYQHLWRPEELGIKKARELIEPLAAGLAKLEADPDGFQKYNASNGWGLYKHFVPFVRNYLEACRQYPDADVHASR